MFHCISFTKYLFIMKLVFMTPSGEWKYDTIQWRIQDFCKGGAAAGAFGVPQAPSCPLSLRPLRKFRGS